MLGSLKIHAMKAGSILTTSGTSNLPCRWAALCKHLRPLPDTQRRRVTTHWSRPEASTGSRSSTYSNAKRGSDRDRVDRYTERGEGRTERTREGSGARAWGSGQGRWENKDSRPSGDGGWGLRDTRESERDSRPPRGRESRPRLDERPTRAASGWDDSRASPARPASSDWDDILAEPVRENDDDWESDRRSNDRYSSSYGERSRYRDGGNRFDRSPNYPPDRRRWEADRGGGRRGWQDEDDDGEPRPPTIRDTWVGDYVYGVAPVLAALRAGRRTIHALHVQEGLSASKRKDKSAVAAAIAAAKELGADVKYVGKHDLNLVCDSRPHQGLILDCSPLEFEPLAAFPPASEVAAAVEGAAAPVWLALDEVTDPQNFGAAVRSAYFLGAAGVLCCSRNCAPLGGVTSKASAGALEVLRLHSARNLPQTLAAAAANGWHVLGASAEPSAMPLTTFRTQRPTILVMGNEGYGLRTNTKRCCEVLLQIDGSPAAGAVAEAGLSSGGMAEPVVDSLNVSVATGILLHHLISSATPKGVKRSELA